MFTLLRRALVAALVLSVATVASAAAHGHQICTPGGGDPVIDPEPFHGDDPTGGAILHNPNVDEAQYNAWGLHPIHHFVHLGPSAGSRAITVVRTGTLATCP